MKKLLTMSFIKSEKDKEKRIAILPEDLKDVKYCEQLYFEKDYGKDFQISDKEYQKYGAHIATKEELLTKDIICDVKIGEAAYLNQLTKNKVLFGWMHAGSDPKLTTLLKENHHQCYAWEDMNKTGRHLFWKNNQIAGAGGVLHALQYTGWLPNGLKVAIVGRGDVAIGAYHILSNLGAEITMYSRKQELLFQQEARFMDIIVMAVRWDVTRKDHLLTKEILASLKKDTLIIDVSADCNGAIEDSVTTSISNPVYYIGDVMVYSVNNIPSIFYKSATYDISKIIAPYIDILISKQDNYTLNDAKIIENGIILDCRIIKAQQ